MSAFENLFAARSYESMVSDYRFLELFSDKILDAINKAAFHNKVTIFRSGPGGGKTSLLQLFGPEPLRRISGNRDVNKEVYARLRGLGVITDNGPRILSVYHRLDTYDMLPEGAQGEDMRDLFTLVGARLTMKWISGILSMNGLNHSHMDRIKIGIPTSGKTLPGSPIPCSGKDLYEWAARTEDAICSATGSFEKGRSGAARRFTGLDHIHMMTPGHVYVDDKAIAARPMIALDDLHRLNDTQRQLLMEHLCEARYPAPVWLAERLDTLNLEDFFNGINGREYTTVELEEHWEGKGMAFESFARSISEKRIQKAGTGLQIMPLPDHLDGDIAPQLDDDMRVALKTIQDRVRAKSERLPRYSKWVAKVESSEGSSLLESLALWKVVEINIKRYERKKIEPLVETPLDDVDEGNDDRKIQEAAELMLCNEFDLPYYYGFKKIAALATFNVELFLELASGMIERVVAQLLFDSGDHRISARDQQKIVKDIAGRHWDDIRRMNANGGDVKRFLESFCRFAGSENTPNAPYAPGVTGFGITTASWEEIKGCREGAVGRLNRVLHTCLAQNYLKLKSVRQGKQGSDPKAVLYLNRLFCAHAGLPVGRGSWRPKSTRDLVEWLDDGGEAQGRGGRHP